MSLHDARPWFEHYAPDVPATVDVPDEDVTRALDRAAARWPERVALDFFGSTLTYRQLADEVARAAKALEDLGVRSGDRVSLVLPNCTAHVVAFYAILRLGAVAVEHNPTHTPDQLRDQVADTGATVALVWRVAVAGVLDRATGPGSPTVVAVDMTRDLPRTKRLALRLPVRSARKTREAMTSDVPADLADWHTLVAAATPLRRQHPRPCGEDTAALLFTGGTTGTPKAARLTHRNLVANAVQGHAWARFTPGNEVVHGVLPFFHAFGLLFCLVLPARIGATLVAFPTFDVPAVLAAQRRRPATFVPGVAPMFDRLLEGARTRDRTDDLRSIRLAFAGAMPISHKTASAWEDATGGLLIEGYGMTETSPITIGNPCSDERAPGTLGLPFPSTDVRVVVQDGTRTPADAEVADDGSRTGELLVQGPQVFAGYWNRPEETAGILLDGGWLRTGDIVRLTAQGTLTLVDRVKEMIVSGGFKVFPSEVEAAVREVDGVVEAAAVGLPDERYGESVVVAIVTDGSRTPSLAEVREVAARSLPGYALPREVVVLDELPRSQIGKVVRRLVREDLVARSTPTG